jgi:hypothetical protein
MHPTSVLEFKGTLRRRGMAGCLDYTRYSDDDPSSSADDPASHSV